MAKVDCFYVHADKSWWTATAEEIDYVPSEVLLLNRFEDKDLLNPNMVTLAELYSSPVLVFPTDGGAFRSYRIGFVYSDTKIDVSPLSKEDRLLFE